MSKIINIAEYELEARRLDKTESHIAEYIDFLKRKQMLELPFLEPNPEYKSFILSHGLETAVKAPETEEEFKKAEKEIKESTNSKKPGFFKEVLLRTLSKILGDWIYDGLKGHSEKEIIEMFFNATKHLLVDWVKNFIDLLKDKLDPFDWF